MKNVHHLIRLIVRTLRIDATHITENTPVEDIPSWDSLTALKVMVAIEQAEALKLPLYRFLQAIRVADLFQLIEEA